MPNCFQLYFNPVYIYVKRSFDLATDHYGAPLYISTVLTGVIEYLADFMKIPHFGMSNFLVFLVLITVFIDAYFGIKSSLKKSKEALLKAQEFTIETPEYRRYMKVYDLKRFRAEKLQFTFFKCLTLLGYLFFIKNLIQADVEGELGSILGFTSGVMLKVPVAIFWYYDFKSIGENSTYIYGKKAPIFTIVESIVEFKIKNYLRK